MEVHVALDGHAFQQGDTCMSARERAQESERRRLEEVSVSTELREQIAALKFAHDRESRGAERLRDELKSYTERCGAATARTEEVVHKLKVEEVRRQEVRQQSRC